MTRTINATRARQNLGVLLTEVFAKNDQFIIERNGRPMAAIIPVWQFEQWNVKREAFFGMISKVRYRNRKASERVLHKETREAELRARTHNHA
jgi:antitoxin (DNA-binding transcriptional repressor) of toxin-antitoxin stability system